MCKTQDTHVLFDLYISCSELKNKLEFRDLLPSGNKIK